MKSIRVLVSIFIISLTLSSCTEKEGFTDYDNTTIQNIKKISADNGEDIPIGNNEDVE